MEHWHRLPREVVEPPYWEISKAVWTRSWAASCRWPCWSRGLDQMT